MFPVTRRAARAALGTALAAVTLAVAGCSSATSSASVAPEDGVVVYSGRSEELVAPLFAQFTAETGIPVEARFGDSAELAAQMLEEGDATPAQVFFSQDAGALGAVAAEGLLAPLPEGVAADIPPAYQSADGTWTGVTGRARVIAYDPEQVPADQVPTSVLALTDPAWKGQVAIAPTNASFQSFVTAMRQTEGDAATKAWLEGLVANDVQTYEKNGLILDAVDSGQAKLGLVNHYYWYEKAAEIGEENLKARNAAFEPGDVGNLVNVAGVAILPTGTDNAASEQFVEFLLSDEAQQYFADVTAEYPLVKGVAARDDLPPLSEIDGPDLTLDQLADLRGTQDLLLQVGLL